MWNPPEYCPATVLGYWGQHSDATVIRYMPCIEPVAVPGRLCAEHTLLVVLPAPAPTLWPAPPASAPSPPPPPPPPAPKPKPKPPPPAPKPKPPPVPPPTPAPKPPPRPQTRCKDCGDLLDPWNQGIRCTRCYRLVQEAAKERKRLAALDPDGPYRVAYPPLVYRCLACHAKLDEPKPVCQRCIETDRWREQTDESMPSMVNDTGALPELSVHRNTRGEWVILGRVQKHARYGESTWDQFGYLPELDD